MSVHTNDSGGEDGGGWLKARRRPERAGTSRVTAGSQPSPTADPRRDGRGYRFENTSLSPLEIDRIWEAQAERAANRVTDGNDAPALSSVPPRPADADNAAVDEFVPSGGQPLAEKLRDHFEARFGHDLGGVRVHTGTTAERLTRSLDAQAYTAGEHIVVGQDHQDPNTTPGRHLLAHELAHTIQQRHATRPVIQRRRIGEPLPDSDARLFDAPVAWGYDEKTNEVFASVLPPGHGLADIAEYLHGSPHYEFQLRDENDLSGEPVPAGTRIRLGDAELTDEAQDELLRAWEDNTILRVRGELHRRAHGQVYTFSAGGRTYRLTGGQLRGMLRQLAHSLVEGAELIASGAETGRQIHEDHRDTMRVRRWISDALAGQDIPEVSMWDDPQRRADRVVTTLSDDALDTEDVETLAANIHDSAVDVEQAALDLFDAEQTWKQYHTGTIEGAEAAADLTGDIALSVAIGAAAIYAAPVVAAAATAKLGVGAVGAWAIAGSSVVAGGGVTRGGLHSTVNLADQLGGDDPLDWSTLGDEFVEGFQLGMIDAGAGLVGLGVHSALMTRFGAYLGPYATTGQQWMTRGFVGGVEGAAAGGFEGLGRGVVEGEGWQDIINSTVAGIIGGSILGGGLGAGAQPLRRLWPSTRSPRQSRDPDAYSDRALREDSSVPGREHPPDSDADIVRRGLEEGQHPREFKGREIAQFLGYPDAPPNYQWARKSNSGEIYVKRQPGAAEEGYPRREFNQSNGQFELQESGSSTRTTRSSEPRGERPGELERLKEGRDFNRRHASDYDVNELYVEKKHGAGYYRLDSYNHREEIVSRKHTQLGEVQQNTARKYIEELSRKYAPGIKIADVPSTPNHLAGKRLDGVLILEIPVQKQPVPPEVIRIAERNNVLIRDINGKVFK